jgi:hypothetical protein
MKFTSKILIGLAILLFAELLSSNIILKKEYDKVDKSDNYWNYVSVLQKPFKYLKITGGNGTKIAYEQSTKCSVRILNEWQNWFKGSVKAHVNNDTLYVIYDFVPENQWNKDWLKNITTVRIFSPELLSVEGFNTKLEMFKIKQKSISVNMTGKSEFELESMATTFDSLNIVQKDSSAVVFEMSPDYKTTESFHVKKVSANVQGVSILDLGHAQIDSLQLTIADSSGIILSGGALKKQRY